MSKDYIIRRTMDEVLPDIPKLWRHPKFVELEDEVAEVYRKEEEAFAEFYEQEQGTKGFQQGILARLARLRHITSLAKVDFCIDTVMEFLGSTDRKLAIFTHHIKSRELLTEKINEVLEKLELPKAVTLATKDKDEVDRELENFKSSEARVIILSTLSHGESLNMQFMQDSILHERQWNPANEDQAVSGRFRRIGATADRINCTILIAVGTIDEYFAELVERKRVYFEESVSGKEASLDWDESSLMMELAQIVAQKGRAWTL